jgi:hypothetical protein
MNTGAENLATFMWRLSENPWSLNLLEPSGPMYTCTGVSLTLLLSPAASLRFENS